MKVDTAKLDSLLDLVGERVITQTLVSRDLSHDPQFHSLRSRRHQENPRPEDEGWHQTIELPRKAALKRTHSKG